MAVSIEFRQVAGCHLNENGHFVLASQGGTTFGLPQLTIAPSEDNIPHIYSVDARVSGLGDAAKTRLFEQYRIPGGALRLRPMRLQPASTPAPGLIELGDDPVAERIEFTVTVGYYDSGPDGKPLEQAPLQATGTAVLLVPPRAKTLATGEPAAIEVSPRHKVLHDGDRLSLLLNLTTSGPDLPPPTTVLADGQERLDPVLRQLIETALTEPARRVAAGGRQPGGYWQRELRIAPDSATHKRLRADAQAAQAAQAAQHIVLVSRFGEAAVQHTFEIDFRPATDMFTDWICIDFGTSNSAVALFDQKRVPAPLGLPKEQLD